MSVSDWSSTADYNTSIDGVSIAEGCAPGNLNNAIRSVMAAIASLFNSFWIGLFAQTTASGVRGALDAAASGANADITSLQSSCTATTQAASDNSTKLATTAYVDRATGGLSFPSVGVSQTWQNETGERYSGTTYTNSTGKPIMVVVSMNASGSGTYSFSAVVGEVTVASSTLGADYAGHGGIVASFIVPTTATYSVTLSGSGYIGNWAELR